jgi:hypothetical protein
VKTKRRHLISVAFFSQRASGSRLSACERFAPVITTSEDNPLYPEYQGQERPNVQASPDVYQHEPEPETTDPVFQQLGDLRTQTRLRFRSGTSMRAGFWSFVSVPPEFQTKPADDGRPRRRQWDDLLKLWSSNCAYATPAIRPEDDSPRLRARLDATIAIGRDEDPDAICPPFGIVTGGPGQLNTIVIWTEGPAQLGYTDRLVLERAPKVVMPPGPYDA